MANGNRYCRTVHISEPVKRVASAIYGIPLYTIGDSATDKVRERQYLDNNWKPLTGTQYLRNETGQLRLERRAKVRGQKIA